MEKIERLLERYKIYIGVKDVKLVVRPYKTRDVFTNLSSSPPTIYLNEHLIDDEEVVEYLLLRELIHIKLHMYRSRYTGGLSYAAKFDNILHFFIPKEKVEEIRGKDGKTDRSEPEASATSFSSFLWSLPAPPRAPRRAPPVMWTRDGEKRLIRLQVHPYRYRLTGLILPVRKYLQARCAESRLSALGLCRSVEYPFVEGKRRLPRGRSFIRALHEDKTKGES
jgi:hypothetical protein